MRFPSQRPLRLEASMQSAMLAGSIGGLAGTVAMSQFQEGWRRLSRDNEQQENLLDRTSLDPPDDEGSAEILSRMASLAGVNAKDIAIKRGGVALHYVFGVAAGTLYGALQGSRGQELNARTFLKGALFGAALFIAAEKFLTFTLRFSPQRSPLGSRKYGLASHVVYGIATAAISDAIRHSL